MDLKDARVHTFVPGWTVTHFGPSKGKGVVDILTEGKEVLERGTFRNWKDHTGKLGADIFGYDLEYQHQKGVAVGEHGFKSEADVNECKDVYEEMLVELDVLADAEMENEIWYLLVNKKWILHPYLRFDFWMQTMFLSYHDLEDDVAPPWDRKSVV